MEKGLLAELLRAGDGSLVGYRGKGRQVFYLCQLPTVSFGAFSVNRGQRPSLG